MVTWQKVISFEFSNLIYKSYVSKPTLYLISLIPWNGFDIGTTKKRTRGQTLCKSIHARSIEEWEEITLNDDGQPIGPSEKIVKDLSFFLGTMARNSTFCPLTYTSWKAMPSDLKEHM